MTSLTIQMGTAPPADEPLEGFGANVTGGTGQSDYHVTTLTATGAGSIMDALSASNRNIIFDVSGTINLGSAAIRYVTAISNFTLDGGGAITLTGSPLWFRTGCDNFIIRNIRHRGGWTGDAQTGDCFTIVGCTNYAFQHVSTSQFTDEGISSTGACSDYTLQDCLIGDAHDPLHNYGSLNDATRGTFLRNAFIGLEYRAPQCEGGLYDIVNCVNVGLSPTMSYAIVALLGAQVNATNGYMQDVTDSTDPGDPALFYHTGMSLVNTDPLPTSDSINTIPGYAQIASPMSAAAAVAHIKSNAGCLPHDATDIALLAMID